MFVACETASPGQRGVEGFFRFEFYDFVLGFLSCSLQVQEGETLSPNAESDTHSPKAS